MTFREQLDSVPRWRLGLIAFVAGAGLVAALAMLQLARGWSPFPEAEPLIISRSSEKSDAKSKKSTVTTRNTYRRETQGFLRVPDGGVLLVPVVEEWTGERAKTDEERHVITEKHNDTTSQPVLPSWTVGVLVGGQFSGSPALKLPNAPGLVLGIEAGYRVPLDRLGVAPRYSLWLEAWGTTSGAAGGGVRGEF